MDVASMALDCLWWFSTRTVPGLIVVFVLFFSVVGYYADAPHLVLDYWEPLPGGPKEFFKESRRNGASIFWACMAVLVYPGAWLSRERKRRRLYRDLMHR
jgi:hypothetical protein